MKNEVTKKKFSDSIHSAISGNLELAELFNSLFKKAEGERKCQRSFKIGTVIRVYKSDLLHN